MVDETQHLIARTPEEFKVRQNIIIYPGHEVTAVEPASGRIRVLRREDGKEWWEPYDQLLLATGASPIRPPLPHIDAHGIYTVNSLADGIALRAAIDARPPHRALVVGGGYIGLEMAENLIRVGIPVDLVEQSPQLMTSLDPDMAALVARAAESLGISLHLGEAVTGFEVIHGAVSAVITDRGSYPAELVVLGLGVQPNSDLARAAGIPLGAKESIRVDPYLRTGIENIWAAGDCAQSRHVVTGRPTWVALGTVANKMGRVAGLNIAGVRTAFPGVAGTAITKVGTVEIARTGLSTEEAAAEGLLVASSTTTAKTRAGYYPGAERITVKLFAEVGTGRMVGGQIVGGQGSGKRIDPVVAAITARMTVDDFLHLDLAYAPPFSPTWDPVLVAARQLLHQV